MRNLIRNGQFPEAVQITRCPLTRRKKDIDIMLCLPVTPVAFEVLLSLSGDDRHGYSIMQDVSKRTGGAMVLHPGTLYRTVARLLEGGRIEELDERPDPKMDDERRRYHRITELGRKVAAGEAARLEIQVATARARHLLPKPKMLSWLCPTRIEAVTNRRI